MNDHLLQSAVRAHQTGNFAEAARLYGDVLRSNPRHFQALYAMGFLYYQVGRFEEASRVIGEAIRVNPRSPEAFFTRGCALQRLNRAPEALTCFDQALALKPGFVEAQSNRGMALMALNRHEQALQSLEVALAFDSSHAASWNNHGCILENLRRHDEAISSFSKAIANEPRFVEAFVNRGTALASLKRFEDAAADFAKALAVNPELPYALGNLILYRLHACDWRNFAEAKLEVAAALEAGKRAVYPFVNVTLSDSMADQLRCAAIWATCDAPASTAPLWRGERYRHDRIRIAYVSADFHAHATAVLMAGVFEHHDRRRFETIAISFGRDDGSEMRSRLKSAFDHFIDVRDRSDAEIASLLRQMEVDIAIDLKGYTQNHRSGIFAHRPAPVQASYLGYPGTMAAPYIDYLLADRIVAPDEHLAFYSEQIAYLPDSYQCNDARRPIAGRCPTRAEAGLPDSGFVFCCFNNSFKIAPPIFDIWIRLLQAVPGSTLWLLEDSGDAVRNLRRAAEARGIGAARLVFAPRVGPPEHLARHRLADLFLDTAPYGAHTTASDALWAGLPVLTTLGSTFASRVAASLLHAAGLPELVTESAQSYEALALRLARDRDLLGEIKAKLARTRGNCALFDTARFTRNLEQLYALMWERSQRGERPARLALSGAAARSIPQAAGAAYVKGCEQLSAGHHAEALALFDEALALAPRFPEALTNRAAALFVVKRYDEALRNLDDALAIDANVAAAWNNRGNVLSELGRYEEAVISYDKVLEMHPGLFEALVNRGTALLALRRAEEALASYDEATGVQPANADAWNGRANALFELKRFEEALRDYETVLKRDPEHPYVAGNLAFCRLHCCQWLHLAEDRQHIAARLRQGRPVVNPFQNIALTQDPGDQRRCAEIWVADKYPASPRPLWKGERYNHKKIRIAYLSADFRDHAVAQLAAGLFEHHDRSRFETVAVSWGAEDRSDLRQRLIGAFDAFLDVSRESDSEVAQRLRDMEIDIAVDLMGFTGESRTAILAARPAPVQISYLGFPGTMGAPYIDGLIADRIVIPESEQHHYSETIVYLPDTYLPTDSERRIATQIPTRHEAGLPDTGFVFASFNNSYKFSPELFDVWMRLLHRTEGSVLWLSSANAAVTANLRREADARNIDSARLIFAPFLPKNDDHLARLSLADLFLDSFSYNAHATAVDALWAGVPLLTCKGSTFAGRVAASLLEAAGIPELIADSPQAYETLALSLAREPSSLAEIRNRLAANRTTHFLFDTPRYTRELERAVVALWESRQRDGSA